MNPAMIQLIRKAFEVGVREAIGLVRKGLTPENLSKATEQVFRALSEITK